MASSATAEFLQQVTGKPVVISAEPAPAKPSAAKGSPLNNLPRKDGKKQASVGKAVNKGTGDQPSKQQRLEDFVPQLNTYVRSRVTGKQLEGQDTTYLEAVAVIGDALAAGSIGKLTSSALPRLCLFGLLSPSLVPQLLTLVASSEKQVARYAAYLLQVQLGAGAAGTPTLPPSNIGGAGLLKPGAIPLDLMMKGWQAIVQPDAEIVAIQAALKTLVAAARGYVPPPGGASLANDVPIGVDMILDKSAQVSPLTSPGKKAADDAALLRYSGIAAARAGVADKRSLNKTATRVLRSVMSPDNLTARHALALAAQLARQDPVGLLDGLASIMSMSVQMYEMTSSMLVVVAKTKSTVGGSGDGVNFQDKFARIYLARLCSNVIHSDRVQGSLNGNAGFFWRMLTLLATRDPVGVVALEAVRSLVGYFPSAERLAGNPGSTQKLDNRLDADMRSRGWQLLLNQSEAQCQGVVGESTTLIGVVGDRVISALQSSSPAVLCSAARSAAAIAEARARAASSQGARLLKGKEAVKMIAALAEGLQSVVEGPMGPTERCMALEALIWLQLPKQPGRVTPSMLLRTVTSSSGTGLTDGGMPTTWPKDLLESLLTTVVRCMRAVPANAELMLGLAGAIAAASPSAVSLSRVADMWTTALKASREAKEAALRAALGVLSSLAPPTANASTGAPQEVLACAAAEDAAWIAFQRMSAWWLGEHANQACDVYAGTVPGAPDMFDAEQPPPPALRLGAGGEALSAGEIIALEAAAKPAMLAIIAALQHAALTMSWQVRGAAAQSIAKLAIRSEEPYRIHCYSILRGLAAADHVTTPDALGVASLVSPAVRVLDAVYATRITLEDLAVRYGTQPLEWPHHIAEQLKERNLYINKLIEENICSISTTTYYPLGPVGKELLRALANEGLERFKGGAEAAAEKEATAKAAEAAAMQAELERAGSSAAADDQGGAPAGKPAWLAKLMGEQASSRAGDSSEEDTALESQPSFAEAEDALAAEMAKLDVAIRGPVPERPAWARRIPALVANSSGGSTPLSRRPTHSRHASMDSGLGSVTVIEGKGMVLHDFEGATDEELSVYQGQEVDLHQEMDGWLMVSTQAGRRGLVPMSFVRVTKTTSLFTDPFSADDPFAGEAAYDPYDDPFSAPQSQNPDGAHQEADPFAVKTAEESNKDEVYREVSIGSVIEPRDDGRPQLPSINVNAGENGRGMLQFPRSETLDISPTFRRNLAAGAAILEEGIHEGTSSEEDGEPTPAEIRFAFDAENDDELSVDPSNDVAVLGEEVDGWFQVLRISDGKRGLVPASYVKLLD